MIMLLLLAQFLFCKCNVNCNDNVLLRSLFLLQCNVYFQDLLEKDGWNILALVMIVLDWKKEKKKKVLSLSQVMLLLKNNNTNTNNRNISIIVVIVIGGVFGADHQRVPIASNGPAAIRPLLSHLLLGKQDLNRFCRNFGSFHFLFLLLFRSTLAQLLDA